MTQLLLGGLMITGFVAGTMLVVRQLYVLTSGKWGECLANGGIREYVPAAPLVTGTVPDHFLEEHP